MEEIYLYFLLGLSIILLILAGVSLSLENCEEEISKTKPRYSKEEVALAEFLADKQAINEAYLSAQAQLLKKSRDS